MIKVSQSCMINSLEMILYLFRICSNPYLSDRRRALECSHGALELFFGIPGIEIFPPTLMRLLCPVPFKHFPLLLRQLFKRCPNPSRVSGKAWRLHVIVKREPLLWNNRFPLSRVTLGLFTP